MATPRKNPVLLELGHRVRNERESREWTQAVLGEKVDVTGDYIGIIERGERGVGLLILNRLALVLGESAIGFKPCRLKRLPSRRPKKRIRK